jgi:hypothetical protein
MDRKGFEAWLEAYGRAWQSNDPEEVAALFEDAAYHPNPFGEPWRGRQAIVDAWVEDPESQDDVGFRHEVLAVAETIGIARWWVSYIRHVPATIRVEGDGIFMVTFDREGRCTEFREWFLTHDRPVE